MNALLTSDLMDDELSGAEKSLGSRRVVLVNCKHVTPEQTRNKRAASRAQRGPKSER